MEQLERISFSFGSGDGCDCDYIPLIKDALGDNYDKFKEMLVEIHLHIDSEIEKTNKELKKWHSQNRLS